MSYRGRGRGRGGGWGGGSNHYSVTNHAEPEHYRKLFIGEISNRTTEKDLREHFEKWGEIEKCAVMRDYNNEPMGSGFIVYKESGMIDKALAQGPHIIDGKEVTTDRPMRGGRGGGRGGRR